MKTIFSITSVLLLIGLATCFTSCTSKSNKVDQPSHQSEDTATQKKVETSDNIYDDMRNMALGVTADQIGIAIPPDQTKVYGVVMDWDMGDVTTTLIAFLSGDASIYLSSGGAVIGGIGHENVKQSAIAFINKAEFYLSKASKTEVTAGPEKGFVQFYLLTNKGKFVVKDEMKRFENNTSEWLPLFEEANKLITELKNSSSKN